MIARVGSGKSTAGLIRYLFDTKEAKDHTDPHLVASWDGFAPDPGRADDFDATKKLLIADLDLRVKQARRLGRGPKQHVWHCSIRAAPEDRILSDDEWADIARRIVAATGIAPEGDPDGCRWVAVRHAPDHIHIAATKVRGDLSPARHWHDYLTADRELASFEKEYGLRQLVRGDRTAAQRPTRAEKEKALRTGRQTTTREHLRTTVRTVVAASTSPEEFIRVLAGVEGVLVDVQRFPSGDIRGYKIALSGDTNAQGEPIWFSGSKLAPDLSYPQIRQRLDATETPPADPTGTRRRTDPWHQATAATERIPHHLDRADDEAAQAHITAFGEALDALPLVAPAGLRPQLRQAATAFERATRSRVRARHDQARALRGAVRALRTAPAGGDGSGLAMFLDMALLAVIATVRWHRLRHHDQQVAAAQQTLDHLRAAYGQAAAAPLAALADRSPPTDKAAQLAQHIRTGIPDHGETVLADPAWPALATTLSEAETKGHDPRRLLQVATHQRTLDDAVSPAEVLTWRIRRLAHRPPPSDRALAAQARSTRAARPMAVHQNQPVAATSLSPTKRPSPRR
ncbi:relaxase/mobilization nuclease domain-containing protein [Streptomyces sp. NPDC020412]|uniref:relaxase/mobilization nuclease domain-containing protein n=1 Tax=Streptomyces sp. NPDC020412 TaxID=3365073 RepID=UPI00378C4D3E